MAPGSKSRSTRSSVKVVTSSEKNTTLKGKKRGPYKKKNIIDEEEKLGDASIFSVEWTNELSQSIVRIITESREIKNGLYPGPGANASTKDGGGRPKTDFFFMVAEALWSDMPNWPEDDELTSAARGKLCDKIKARLRRMEKDVIKYKEEIGETGAGIERSEDIDMNQDNALTNAWERIRIVCPWFFEMKALMAERPNRTPVGLGNSASAIEIDDIIGGDEGAITEEASSPASGGAGGADQQDQKDESSDVEMFENDSNDGTYVPDSMRRVGKAGMVKETAKETAKEKVKETAKVAKAKETEKRKAPNAPAPAAPSKKFKISDEFAETTKTMETTRQKSLDLAAARVTAETQKMQYKMAKLQAKTEERKMRHEIEMMKEKRRETRNRLMETMIPNGSGLEQGWNMFPGASIPPPSESLPTDQHATSFEYDQGTDYLLPSE